MSPIKVSEWIEKLTEGFPSESREEFERVFNGDEKVIEERRKAYLNALRHFGEIYGADAEVVVARAPGRVNLMGRHVDYMGGSVNPMATDMEIFALVQERQDDWVPLHNMDPEFGVKKFRIGDELPEEKIENLDHWDRWTSKRFREKVAAGEQLDWDEYFKGLTVYLQDYYRRPD